LLYDVDTSARTKEILMSEFCDPKVTIAKTEEGVYVTIDFPIVDVDGYKSEASYTVCLGNDDSDGSIFTFHDNQQFDDTHYRNFLPEFSLCQEV
jgi:hypothetical protein